MISTCLSVCRQGWLGVPIFLIGIATLAFSQLAQETEPSLSPEEKADLVEKTFSELSTRLSGLRDAQKGAQIESLRSTIKGNLDQLISVHGNSDPQVTELQAKFGGVDEKWISRSKEVGLQLNSVSDRLGEAKLILNDLKENFAGRMDEAVPALNVLHENLKRSKTEMDALTSLSNSLIGDVTRSYGEVESESGILAQKAIPNAPSIGKGGASFSTKAEEISRAINSTEAIPLDGPSRFAPSIRTDAGVVSKNKLENTNAESSEIINKLRSELAASKSVQSELSADTADLQGDLRKAYREIVSLQTSLQETQMLAKELQDSKNSLWNTDNGERPTAQAVSSRINRLESDLQAAREDLRSSRQSLLVEQERSNAMLRSVTNELERTRAALDTARSATMSSGADAMRLEALERELNEARRALQMAQMAPMDSTKESYLTLQNELRKALGEITRMQVELNEKDELEAQLIKLQNSMESFADSPGRGASQEYVAKLLIDLNAAKLEVEKAKSQNRAGREDLIEQVALLEDELKVTKLALKKTKAEYEASQEMMAKREFEYANTIQRLEEEAQLAENSLRDASLGKLPAIPFVEEMERNLADSEARIERLSNRFEAEQAKATDLIDGLQVELDAAIVRQKRALDQLARKELELEGRETELKQAKEDSKKLKEELEVVKVIAGQLEDLNTVLEQTKRTQNSQSGSMDQVIESLREELNQAKVELVFAKEDNDKLKAISADTISTLELQLENTRNQLLAEQENLADQTNESKELVIDLKSELDAARSEIARMKSAGLGESVETKQAVSQLQEALGTIRILQESLEEAEKVNLDVDNLRIELANSMESHLSELQRSEDEKNLLRKQAEDLEAEIMVLREQGLGAGVQFKRSNAAIMEELEISKARVLELEKRAEMSEDNEVLSLVELEEELAQEKARNQELQQELSTKSIGHTKTVELLEKELAASLKKLDELEDKDISRKREIAKIENEIIELKSQLTDQSDNGSLADDEKLQIISQLEEQLQEANNRLAEAKNVSPSNPNLERIEKLESELALALKNVSALQNAKDLSDQDDINLEMVEQLEKQLLETQNKLASLEKADRSGSLTKSNNELIEKLENDLVIAERKTSQLQAALDQQDLKREDLKRQLDNALEKLNLIAQGSEDSEKGAEDYIRLENELQSAQQTINDLMEKTESEKSQRAKLEEELNLAMQSIKNLEGGSEENTQKSVDPADSAVVEELQALLDSKDKKLKELEDELSNAIVEMTEKEAELEMAASMQQEMEILANKLKDAEQKLEGLSEDNQTKENSLPDAEKELLLAEIDKLKVELASAKSTAPSTENRDQNINDLQKQLQDAVAESMEMQTELEDTKSRLAAMESSSGKPSLQLAQVIEEAKEAESLAGQRINDLTQALRNSEGLRKEMELLLLEAEQADSTQPVTPNLASDPRFIEIQKELLLLQQDLLAAREVEEPRVKALQLELEASQNDSYLLNEEFKSAMEDFGRIKEQVAILEEENRRLQNSVPSSTASDSNNEKASMQNRINKLSQENANLRIQIGERDSRVSGLREDLARAQMSVPGIRPDNAALRAQIVRLEGAVQVAQDGENRSKIEAQRIQGENQSLVQRVALLEESLRQAQSQARGVPSSLPSYTAPPQVVVRNVPNPAEAAEVIRLREQNQRLQAQLMTSSTIPQRDQLDRKIRELNQKNLTAQIQLDQERSRVEDLRKQLDEARNIKQEVVERGQSANMKVRLLNDELSDAQKRIASLENALISAREAIKVLKSGGSGSSTMKVSVPKSSFTGTGSTRSPSSLRELPSNRTFTRTPLPTVSYRTPGSGSSILQGSSLASPSIQKIPVGNSSIQLRAQVQFLNNKNRPAGFTEFFLVKNDLESILQDSRIRIPQGQGIDSGAELWARSVQRGYRYPGVASAIRNALATKSLARIKTNSMGEANLENVESGNYYLVGSSPLGQVGVVWSKRISLNPGTNKLVMDLRDATWAE